MAHVVLVIDQKGIPGLLNPTLFSKEYLLFIAFRPLHLHAKFIEVGHGKVDCLQYSNTKKVAYPFHTIMVYVFMAYLVEDNFVLMNL